MSSSWPRRFSAGAFLGLAALFVWALAWRVWGIAFGFPLLSNFYVRPDETLLVVPAVELWTRHGDPGHLYYPALMIDLLAAVAWAVHGVGVALGALPDRTLIDDFAAEPSRYFLLGRLLGALGGAATVLVIYGLARRWARPGASAVAALWYAVAPLAVREAHFAVTDTPMTLFLLAAWWALVRYLDQRPPGCLAGVGWCGLWAGLAMATKYPAVAGVAALAPIFLLAPVSLPWRVRVRNFFVFALSILGVFCLTNPYVLMHGRELAVWLGTVFRAIYQTREPVTASTGLAEGSVPAAVYFGFAPASWVGLGFVLAGLIAGFRCAGTRAPTAVLTAALLGYLALLLPAERLPFRYVLPLLPLLAVGAAAGIEACAGRLRDGPRALLLLLIAFVGLDLTLPTARHLTRSLVREDSRAEAGRWIEAEVPAGVPVLWRGEMEVGPQVVASVASLQRLMADVERRYGPRAARSIHRIYRLRQTAAAARSATARELYWNPQPGEVPGKLECRVTARYPLPMVGQPPRPALAAGERLLKRRVFGEVPLAGRYTWDPTDAFFLPINPDRLFQPGPELTVMLVEKKTED